MPIFRPRRRNASRARIGVTPSAITRRCLDSALACAASAYPNEFGGILRADSPGTISELLLLPGTTAGHRHANFQLYMMPVDLGTAGTVHSHPSGALHPSEADVRLFRHWGRRHIILGYPFGPGQWRAYDGNGEDVPMDVVGVGGIPSTVASPRVRRSHRESTHPASMNPDDDPARDAE
jgi:proteasome lid subunit RPN8/RPN11